MAIRSSTRFMADSDDFLARRFGQQMLVSSFLFRIMLIGYHQVIIGVFNIIKALLFKWYRFHAPFLFFVGKKFERKKRV
jgi:hypothetical protein